MWCCCKIMLIEDGYVKKKFSLLILCLGFLFCFQVPDGQAYDFNDKKFSNPKDAFYWIDPTFDSYKLGGDVKSGILAWNAVPEINFTKKVATASGVEASIEYLDKYNGNTYGQRERKPISYKIFGIKMNGQIVLYMECYPPICSNRLSYFIVLTGA